MLDLSALMGPSQFEKFMQGVVRGKYHVLMGAGASHGGLDGHGMPLPSGLRLAADLSTEFGLDDAEGVSLKRVYAYAEGKVTTSGLSRDAYMNARFTNTTPPHWMSMFVRFPWAHLWTLNIDDCLERAYHEQSKSARQKPLSISWSERHATPKSGQDEVMLVHLHGKASRASRGDELIFDISAYLRAVHGKHRWHTIFGDDYPSQPFLVLGASLDEELDLQVVLEQGALRGGLDEPSIIVNKDMTSLAADEFKRFGLLPIAATVEEFFEAVELELGPFVASISAGESEKLALVAAEAITFASQWTKLERLAKPVRDKRHDVYVGHEPEWIDVHDDLLVIRGVVQSAVDQLVSPLAAGKSKLVLMTGDIFSGKTATCLTVAERLLTKGYQPFLFAGSGAPSIPAAMWWLRHYPKTVLILDNASDFAADVSEIVEMSEISSSNARILMIDRSGSMKHIQRELGAVDWSPIQLAESLSDGEIEGFIRKLEQKRRLGVITNVSHGTRVEHFKSHNRQLFGAMAALERGRGFESRVRDEYDAIPSSEAKQVVALAAVASSVGYGFPLGALPRASGLSAAEVSELLETPTVADLLHVRNRAVLPRHRVFGSLLVETSLDPDERYRLAIDIAVSLAPHISPAAISDKSSAYRLLRSLMNHSQLKSLFANDHQRVLDWYKAIEEFYDWNARYWEQRALAASDAGFHEPAYSWASQAVAVRRDPFTLTTVGTVLMRRAIHEANVSSWPVESWESAEAALSEATQLEGGDSEYPYETFFQYTLWLVEKVTTRDEALDSQLQAVWQLWHSRCLTLDPPSRRRMQPMLSALQPRWLAAMSGS